MLVVGYSRSMYALKRERPGEKEEEEELEIERVVEERQKKLLIFNQCLHLLVCVSTHCVSCMVVIGMNKSGIAIYHTFTDLVC